MRPIKHPIRKKIMLGFGVIITLMIISNAFVLYQLNEISKSTKDALTKKVAGIDLVKRLQTILLDEERNANKFVITNDRAYYGLFLDGSREFDSYMDSLLFISPKAEETEVIHQIRQIHAWFVDIVGSETRKAFVADTESHDSFMKGISDNLYIVHSKFNQIILNNQLTINNAMFRVETTTRNALLIAFILTFGTLVLAILLAMFTARTITHPIDLLIGGTEKIAGGSFEPIHVSSNDEIALLSQAINEMSEKLKKIDEYKAQMMQQISHEIRSPLQMIILMHHILTSEREGPLNEEQRRMLDAIRSTVDRVTNFSNQFLDLAKTEAGMMQYNLVSTDIIGLVIKIINEMEFSFKEKNIAVDIDILPSPNVMIDVEKMSMVIGNLMTNAIKYTQKNGKIRIQAGPSNKSVRISVSDTGIGISSEDIPHIFTRFYRASNASKYGSTGTGVGLALVKALTEGLGGKISVTSTVGVGSTFTIELPTTPVKGQLFQPKII